MRVRVRMFGFLASTSLAGAGCMCMYVSTSVHPDRLLSVKNRRSQPSVSPRTCFREPKVAFYRKAATELSTLLYYYCFS